LKASAQSNESGNGNIREEVYCINPGEAQKESDASAQKHRYLEAEKHRGLMQKHKYRLDMLLAEIEHAAENRLAAQLAFCGCRRKASQLC